MELPDCIEEMKTIQKLFLDFIENEESLEDYINLINYKYFENLNDQEKSNKLIEIIYLISNITNFHHHTTNFFTNIEKIISHFKEDIKRTLSNYEIYNIFRKNKRILLFLFKEQIITIDYSIISNLSVAKEKYYDYFLYEILSFYKGTPIDKNEENFKIFDSKRKIGENENYICNLIRNDQVKEFIVHVNKTNLSLSTIIEQSIFETNRFLIDKNPTLIEYSAFFGSLQIFKYLQMNKVELTPSLWIYAIHGQNPDLIHILEENEVKPNNDNSYTECFIESVKCNHINFAEYLLNNYLQCQDLTEFSNDVIEYRNYHFFPNYKFNSPTVFYNLVKFNYPFSVNFLLNNIEVDINYKYKFKTRQILRKGGNSNGFDDDVSFTEIEQNLIHVAVLNSNKEIVRILVSNPRININDKMINIKRIREFVTFKDHTPIRHAIHKITSNALHLAVENGNANIVKIILSHPDIDVDDLLEIYDFEKVEILGYFASTLRHVDTNLKRTALHAALYNKKVDIALILLSKNVKLQNEIKKSIYTDMRIKREGEEDKNEQKTTLYIAIQNGLNEIIKFILTKCKIDVNENILINHQKSYYDYDDDEIPKTTALYASVEKGNVEIVKFLLSFPNIDVNICQIGGKSALHLAAEKNYIEIVKLLLTNPKTDINKYYTYEQELENGQRTIMEIKNPLYWAVENENIEMVKLLISQPNIDINAYCILDDVKSPKRSPDDEIFTKTINMLYLSVEKKNIKIIELLLSHPNIDTGNKSIFKKLRGIYGDDESRLTLIEEIKKSGLQLAIEQKNKEIIDLFLNVKKFIYNPI